MTVKVGTHSCPEYACTGAGTNPSSVSLFPTHPLGEPLTGTGPILDTGDSQAPSGSGYPLLCGREAGYRTTMGRQWVKGSSRASDPGCNLWLLLEGPGLLVGYGAKDWQGEFLGVVWRLSWLLRWIYVGHVTSSPYPTLFPPLPRERSSCVGNWVSCRDSAGLWQSGTACHWGMGHLTVVTRVDG